MRSALLLAAGLAALPFAARAEEPAAAVAETPEHSEALREALVRIASALSMPV